MTKVGDLLFCTFIVIYKKMNKNGKQEKLHHRDQCNEKK